MKLPEPVEKVAKEYPLCVVYCVGAFVLGVLLQGWVPGA